MGSGSGPPTATGTGGAAASVERIATQAAIDTLRAGGNAVDAAVAAGGVLGVTEPFSAGIGGGGFMVIYRASDGKVTTIDSRETAPAAMTPTSFVENNSPLPFDAARYSGLSVGVPGTVEGWAQALERYGTMSLAQLLAARYSRCAARLRHRPDVLRPDEREPDFFDDVPASAALYLDPDGTPRDVGTVFTNPDLARTYERIAHLGPKGFYRGAVADALVETVRNPPVAPTANHIWRAGVMKMRDLHTYTAPERAPTHVRYRGKDVYSMGPPSSGGSTVGEALNILEGYDLSAMPRDRCSALLPGGVALFIRRPQRVPRGSGLFRCAARRTPLQAVRGHAPRPDHRYRSDVPSPAGGSPPVQPGSASLTALRSETTTHLTTSDKWGNVVSYTFTIESTGGSGLVVPGFGFLLNNELTDFNFDSTTHPNRVEGGKRPRSSMSPTIVLQGGKPFVALGSPGGSMIITTVLQLLVDRIDLGLTLPHAIADPRASQRNTLTTSAEPAFIAGPDAAALSARGHSFTSTAEIGAATGIEFLPDGTVLAAAEPVRRGGGSAMVESP